MYKAESVADYIIFYSNFRGYQITNPKLQSLLYLLQVDYLSKKDRPLFIDKIEAWSHGPVITPVNTKYISNLVTNIAGPRYEPRSIKKDDKRFVRDLIELYKDYSPSDLNKIITKQAPFIKAQNSQNNEITIDAIAAYLKA